MLLSILQLYHIIVLQTTYYYWLVILFEKMIVCLAFAACLFLDATMKQNEKLVALMVGFYEEGMFTYAGIKSKCAT